RTPATASGPRLGSECSSASGAATTLEPPAPREPAWAWRSRAAWSRLRAAGSGPSLAPAAARGCASRCRATGCSDAHDAVELLGHTRELGRCDPARLQPRYVFVGRPT